MATLAQIAQQVIFKLSGGDAQRDTQFDMRMVQLFVVQELNYSIKVEYWNNIKMDGEHGISGQYIVPFSCPVLWNASKNAAYIVVPTPYITLGASDRGIQEIRPPDENAEAFIPLANGMHSLLKGTRLAALENHIGYYPELGNVYFTKDPRAKGIVNVTIKEIVGFPPNLIVDPGTEADIVEKVYQKLLARQPQDKLNNNNPNA